MGVFSHEGNRVISFLRPAGPTIAVLSAYASDGSSGFSLPPETKSENEGPAFSLSLKVVAGRRVVPSGVLEVAEEASAVA